MSTHFFIILINHSRIVISLEKADNFWKEKVSIICLLSFLNQENVAEQLVNVYVQNEFKYHK